MGRNCAFEKLIPQRFTIPSSIVYYMAQNPASAVVYQKLIQSCKYFYPKNPIIVADEIIFHENKVVIRTRKEFKFFETFDTKQFFCKFWFVIEVLILKMDSLAIEFLHNKMFRTNRLRFVSVPVVVEQVLTPEVVQSVKTAYFSNTIPEYADGTPVPVQKVLELFPNIECFDL